MNKNFIPFIYEANRVLKIKGKLLIAEISSRIINLKNFLEIFKQLNFKLFKQKNIENYFTILSFKKISDAKINKKLINKENTFDILKPCLYKKR
jgi:ubiquinone/menaquinone biosynthesis C-methylase UbiE